MSSEPPTTPDTKAMVKKDIKVLKTLVEKATGVVKWYNLRNLYGFIHRAEENEDIFVHKTAITNYNKFPSLRIGEQVEFKIVQTTNGIEAAEVTGPDGSKVKGFRFMNGARQRGGANQDNNGEGRNGDQDIKPKINKANGNAPIKAIKKSDDESGDAKKKGPNSRGGRGRRPNNGQMNGAPRYNGAPRQNGDEMDGVPRGTRPTRRGGAGGRGGANSARGPMRGGRGRGGASMPTTIEQNA